MRRLFVGLRKEEVPDILFVPTVWVHHLIGWWLFQKAGFLPEQTRLLLFFPNAPLRLPDEGQGQITPDPTGKLFRWLIRRFGPKVRQGRVVLGAETHAMQRALSEATGVEFTYLPHPVEVAPTNHCQPLPASPSRPLIFGCYGGARWEKGSDVLQAAIRMLLKKEPEIQAKFAFQWIEDFDDEHGRRVTLDPWLAGHPKVEVIRRYFREGEYAERLAQTDVMVLPYRSPYRLRVSRVAIEALIGGIPVIATRGSTLAEQAGDFGAIVELDEISSLDLARCLQKALRDHKALRKIALEMMEKACSHFSVSHFREKLLGVRV